MAPKNPRDQSVFFYTGQWTAEYEKEFISHLADYARVGGMSVTRSDVVCIRHSIDVVNIKYGTNFSYKDGQMRFKHLQQRHSIFRFIVTLKYIEYDIENNVIHADDIMWDYVTLKHPLAKAYMIQGEANWSDMCAIFGIPTPVDVHTDPEVIQISDSTSNHIDERALEHSPRRALSNCVERASIEISPAFWDTLGRIVPSHDVSNQDSVNEGGPSGPARSMGSFAASSGTPKWHGKHNKSRR